jgi:hypothetical protein
MNDNQNRRHQMFIRVREFMAQRVNDFSETGVARQLFTQLKGLITGLDTQAAAQATGFGQAHQRTQTRGDARDALHDDLEAIHNIAASMGVIEQFVVPATGNDRNLLQAARSFATNALPLKAQFIAHEMPGDFLDELQTGITQFEAEIAAHGNAVGDHVEAGIAIETTIDDGVEIVRKLDGIMRTKYATAPAILAEWFSASHTERAPKHAVAPPPPPTPGATPASGATPPAAA